MEDEDAAPAAPASYERGGVVQEQLEQLEALRMELADAKAEVREAPHFHFHFTHFFFPCAFGFGFSHRH